MKQNASACARPEDQRYPAVKTFAWGLQHVLTMYGGIIAPPLIIGSAAGLGAADIGLLVTAALFISGLSTLLQSFGLPFFGSRQPLVQGVSFAGVATMVIGSPVFNGAAILSMFLIVLVLLTETTAGLMAIGEIVGTEVDGRRIANGLRADMLTSAIAPVFNSFPQSAFAQNIGLVALTGIKSRFVVSAGGAILVVLGLLPVLGRIIACIPMPVLGGAGVVLFGSVAASGIRTLAKVDYRENMNLVVVATALAFGMIPIVMPTFYDRFPDWVHTLLHSGISATCLVAFVLNILFNTRLFPSRRRLPEAS
jgi:xanthine/uracil permease